MSLFSALFDVHDFIRYHQINSGDITISDRNAYMTIWSMKDLPSNQRRAIKRAFGKLKPTGSPPNVTLYGKTVHGDTIITINVYGGYECSVVSERQVTKEIPAVEAQPARIETSTVYEWSCKPALTEEEF